MFAFVVFYILRVFIFCSVWFLSKKNNQNWFLKKKPQPIQIDRFRFGYFEKKISSNRFDSVFSVRFFFVSGL